MIKKFISKLLKRNDCKFIISSSKNKNKTGNSYTIGIFGKVTHRKVKDIIPTRNLKKSIFYIDGERVSYNEWLNSSTINRENNNTKYNK